MLRTGKNLAIRCSYGMVSQLLLATVRRLLKQIQYFWLIRYLSFVNQIPWLNQNNSLLSGSRLTNFVGILNQGLRIAPPEAPATGYMVSTLSLPLLVYGGLFAMYS